MFAWGSSSPHTFRLQIATLEYSAALYTVPALLMLGGLLISDDDVVKNPTSKQPRVNLNPNYPGLFSKQFIPGGGIIITRPKIHTFSGVYKFCFYRG